jgi:hypothetical protein
MKKLIAVIVFLTTVSANAQTNIFWCLEYMTTNHPGSTWMLQDDSNGLGVYIKSWNSTLPKPTIAEALAVWSQAAPWKTNLIKGVQCDFENWNNVSKEELKAFVLVLIDEINILRAKDALPNRTPAQLKAAIKGKL